ncbi:MAG TPA: TetR/AcrR family transcriptional regulator [Jatrophihabitantaceae bacterium]|jgi:AcrR family transcriptional regulator|nr:TetR/AcrR family transcriptional regulator [Jatrophihabitantaceae bacterium]
MSVSAPPRRRRAQRGSGEQLRAEIITAAKTLLADAANADDVSIRAVADAVGVTAPSIYLHFADKNELLGAVVSDVFTTLDTAMLEAGSGVDSPMAKLRAFGLAYVQFALAHPEHYRIATMDPCPMPVVDEVMASSAFVHFNDTVIECIEAGVFPAGDPLPVTLDLWAAAHGIASLMIAKPFLPWGEVEVVADRALCAAALGHAARALIGDAPTPDQVTAWLDGQHRAARENGG